MKTKEITVSLGTTWEPDKGLFLKAGIAQTIEVTSAQEGDQAFENLLNDTQNKLATAVERMGGE